MSLAETAYTSARVSTGCEEWAPISRDGAPPLMFLPVGSQVQMGASSTQTVLNSPGTKNSTNTKFSDPSFKVVMLALVVINDVTWSQSVWLFVGVDNALARNHILKMLRILVIMVRSNSVRGIDDHLPRDRLGSKQLRRNKINTFTGIMSEFSTGSFDQSTIRKAGGVRAKAGSNRAASGTHA